ncbi:MAG: hypothetical protein QM308_05050 [Bacillota bacterium]|nr:hypothetical protein [Bacillota bacterium]
MRKMDLDRAFKETPPVFSGRVEQTLLNLKEEPMKKVTLRTIALAAAMLLALTGLAFAAIHYGQEWYFNNRDTGFKEHKPDVHQAILDNLQTDIAQKVTGPAGDIVTLQVQDAAWLEDKQIVTIGLLASLKEDAAYELHPLHAIDTDGATVGEIDPEDEESRLDHWLWTEKGFGLPKDVMTNPEKQLLLIELGNQTYIGDTQAELPASTFDVLATEEGSVMALWTYDLSYLDISLIDSRFSSGKTPESMSEEEYKAMIQESKDYLTQLGQDAIDAIRANMDENGRLKLRLPFHVQTLKDNVFGEEIPGELTFTLQIKTK